MCCADKHLSEPGDHQDKGDEDVESIASVLTTLQLNKGLPTVAKPPWQDALASEFGVMSMQVKLGVYLKTRGIPNPKP